MGLGWVSKALLDAVAELESPSGGWTVDDPWTEGYGPPPKERPVT